MQLRRPSTPQNNAGLDRSRCPMLRGANIISPAFGRIGLCRGHAGRRRLRGSDHSSDTVVASMAFQASSPKLQSALRTPANTCGSQGASFRRGPEQASRVEKLAEATRSPRGKAVQSRASGSERTMRTDCPRPRGGWGGLGPSRPNREVRAARAWETRVSRIFFGLLIVVLIGISGD